MISANTRRTVRTIYGFACGYCGVTENELGANLTVDHFVPQDAGGSDRVENLVYSCHACNMFKSAAWNAQSPPVLHPLHTDVTKHIALQSDGTLKALTLDGGRHIETLHLNRAPLIALRNTRRLTANLLEMEARLLEREKQLNAQTQRKRQVIRLKKKRQR